MTLLYFVFLVSFSPLDGGLKKTNKPTDWYICGVCAFQTCLSTKASDEIRRKEACGACEEPIWEKPIRNTVSPLSSFPVFSLHFGVTCWGDVKHVWVASFVRLAGYGFEATKIRTCSAVCSRAADFIVVVRTNEKMNHTKAAPLSVIYRVCFVQNPVERKDFSGGTSCVEQWCIFVALIVI